jgi:hypothetical protein
VRETPSVKHTLLGRDELPNSLLNVPSVSQRPEGSKLHDAMCSTTFVARRLIAAIPYFGGRVCSIKICNSYRTGSEKFRFSTECTE